MELIEVLNPNSKEERCEHGEHNKRIHATHHEHRVLNRLTETSGFLKDWLEAGDLHVSIKCECTSESIQRCAKLLESSRDVGLELAIRPLLMPLAIDSSIASVASIKRLKSHSNSNISLLKGLYVL